MVVTSFLLFYASVVHYVVMVCFCFFFFKQKTAYEMRISDWSSDVCSSDLAGRQVGDRQAGGGPECGRGHARQHRLDPHALFGKLVVQGLGHGEDVAIGRASCRERVCQYV